MFSTLDIEADIVTDAMLAAGQDNYVVKATRVGLDEGETTHCNYVDKPAYPLDQGVNAGSLV